MANQLTLAFSVSTVSTIYTPTQAAAKLAAVPLYASAAADPVLGQAFGLTVASGGDTSAPYSQAVLTATDASPIVVGVASTVGLANGMPVTVVGATGNTAANGSFKIAALTPNSFALVGSTGNGAYTGGGVVTAPVATRTLVLNMTSVPGAPQAPPPFPCRPTGPLTPPPGAPPAPPYALTETTIDRYTRKPVTLAAPAALVALYSTSDLDTDGVATTPAIPAGSGAQVVTLTYMDSTGVGGPFTVTTALKGKFPAVVALHAGSVDVAEVTACFVSQTGAFANSVGQITLAALSAAPAAVRANAEPADFPGLADAAQLLIARPLVYLPPSYFALAQQQASAPRLSGDFWVKQGSPTVLTTVDQTGVLAATNVVEFAAQRGVQYEVASVSATFVKLTTAYTGLSHAEIAPAAEAPYPAQSVSEEADAVVSSAVLVSPSQAEPPDSAHLTTLLAEFTLPQSTAPALTYVAVAGGPFTPGETVRGQKSTGSAEVLYDNPGVDASGTLAFVPDTVKIGFVRGETVTGSMSHATATVVVQRTLATNPLPTKLSGLYARALALVLGAPVTSQPITLL